MYNNEIIFCKREVCGDPRVTGWYFLRMNFLKINGKNFKAASWPLLISSNFKDQIKRPAIIHGSQGLMGCFQNCPNVKELDLAKKGLLGNRLSC